MRYTFTLLSIFVFLLGCKENKVLPFSEKIEDAHHKDAFLKHKAIQFDIALHFGGNLILDGNITLLTNSSKGLIREKNGNSTYFNDKSIFVDTSKVSLESARFSAYTWSYFFMFPYKLNDPGTKWTNYLDNELNGKNYATEKLTFNAGTGDAPDDWYIVYADPEDYKVQVAAYIVTAGGGSIEEAEVDPHAIAYKNYKIIDGIPISTEWIFHAWRKEGGLTEQLGNAKLKNIIFMDEINDGFFKAPNHFIEG